MLNEKPAFLLLWWREEFDTLTMLGNDEIMKFMELTNEKRRMDAAHHLQTVRIFCTIS